MMYHAAAPTSASARREPITAPAMAPENGCHGDSSDSLDKYIHHGVTWDARDPHLM